MAALPPDAIIIMLLTGTGVAGLMALFGKLYDFLDKEDEILEAWMDRTFDELGERYRFFAWLGSLWVITEFAEDKTECIIEEIEHLEEEL